MANKLSTERRAQILSCLIEGNSIRSTSRMTGAAKGTVLKLLKDAGRACAEYQSKTLVGLPCKEIQCDEIWAFVGCKEKNVKPGDRGRGDVWTWVAMCQETKLVPCWKVSDRTSKTAVLFMWDLASRLKKRVQLSTDGLSTYEEAVEDAFGMEVDYAQIVKIYGKGYKEQDGIKYSQPYCKGVTKKVVKGKPDKKKICTSHVERQNLTIRMHMRRFTRLTNAFSKKLENLEHAVALHFMHYNFCRIHSAIRVTPAMEAGIMDRVWELRDIVELIDAMPKEKTKKVMKWKTKSKKNS